MPNTITTPRPDDRRRLTAGTSSAPELFVLAAAPEGRPPVDRETPHRPVFEGAAGDAVGCYFRFARQDLSSRSSIPDLEVGS